MTTAVSNSMPKRTGKKKLYPMRFCEKDKVHPVTCHESTVRK